MNTAPPVLPPASTPDPTTPGPSAKPTALGSAIVTGTGGTTIATFLIWLIDTYWTVGGKHLDATTAATIAGALTAIGGYAIQVIRGLISKQS